jgi:hypothetical protein
MSRSRIMAVLKIKREEWWPIYEPSKEGIEVEVPDDLVQKISNVFEEFHKMQGRLEDLYEEARDAEVKRENDYYMANKERIDREMQEKIQAQKEEILARRSKINGK